MKKKTIKFYFFKSQQIYKFPNLSFCFSKKALYQNQQIVKYIITKTKITKKYLRKKKKTPKTFINYNFYIRNNVKIKQWNKNKFFLKTKFFRSFFYSSRWFCMSKKYKWNLYFQLRLWFVLKNKFNKFIRQFIIKYPKLGFITSQTTHSLSRKNLSYQSWPKYKSKLYNMNFFNKWIYLRVKYNNVYFSSLLKLLYSFSINPSLRSLYYDDCFSPVKTPYIYINLYNNYSPYKNFLNYNYIYVTGAIYVNFNYTNLFFLRDNNMLIENALIEVDKKTREALQKNIELKSEISVDFLFLRFFVSNKNNSYDYNLIIYLYFSVLNYIFIYNIINNIDISPWIAQQPCKTT